MVNLSTLNEKLRKRGYRSSNIREEILKVLTQTQGPISIASLQLGLQKSNLNPNKTSIYREIDTLLKECVIEEFDLGEGKKRYEIKPLEGHHHHLICTSCGKIKCLEMDSDLEILTNQIEAKTGYKIFKHNLDFVGLCNTCQK